MGVVRNVLRQGDGASFPRRGQMVSVHYTGYLNQVGGKKFDSSVDRGRPFQFKVGAGEVIKGWDEGVAQMTLGEKCTLTCTPDYGYGAGGYPPIIPPNSTLVFEVRFVIIDFLFKLKIYFLLITKVELLALH